MTTSTREIDGEFSVLFQQVDIYHHGVPQRNVWMLVEKSTSGPAVYIFSEKPPIEMKPEGFISRVMGNALLGNSLRGVIRLVADKACVFVGWLRQFQHVLSTLLAERISFFRPISQLLLIIKSVWTRLLKGRIRRFVRLLTRQRVRQVHYPYIPYEAAIVGIQIEIHDNNIEVVVWDPVPPEDYFPEGPDLPENPTVHVIIDNIDAYRPIVPPDGAALDGTLGENDDLGSLDEHPF